MTVGGLKPFPKRIDYSENDYGGRDWGESTTVKVSRLLESFCGGAISSPSNSPSRISLKWHTESSQNLKSLFVTSDSMHGASRLLLGMSN